jgi:hypothetical protein
MGERRRHGGLLGYCPSGNTAAPYLLNPDPLHGTRACAGGFDTCVNKENYLMPIILWLLGVPLSVIILLMLFGFLH